HCRPRWRDSVNEISLSPAQTESRMRHRPRRNNCVLSPPVSGHNPGTDDMEAGQLTKMLKAHQVWQSSGGTEGHRAHRDHANLEETPNLAGANLQRAILNS